jgi:hypothetical protein
MGVDRVTNGPLNSAGTNPQDQFALILDSQNNFVESSIGGARQILRARIAVWRALAQLVTITTAQTLFSKIFNANALGVLNRTIFVKATVVYASTTANVATITFAITLGGVTICSITTAATNTTASTNLPIEFEFELNVAQISGIYGVVIGHGAIRANISSNSPAAAIAEYLDTNLDFQNQFTVATNPTAGETILVNGTLVTFIVNGGTPVGNQVALGANATATATALYTFLAASTDANIAKATWTNPSNGVVQGVSNAAGFVPWALASVPAHITTLIGVVNLTAAATLAVTIAASGSGLPSAQVQYARMEVVA